MRWKKGDYISLGKAVSNFNKKINELNKEEKKLYLPELENYQQIKSKIKTRAELEAVKKSLKEFTKEGAEEIVNLGNIETTKWQQKEFKKLARRAEKNLKFSVEQYEIPKYKGMSKAMMGNRLYEETLDRIRNLKEYEIKSRGDFIRLKERLEYYGNLSYTKMKATIFRQNFMRALESQSNLQGYELLTKKLNRIKNPENFYKYVSKSEVFSDIFVYYKPR